MSCSPSPPHVLQMQFWHRPQYQTVQAAGIKPEKSDNSMGKKWMPYTCHHVAPFLSAYRNQSVIQRRGLLPFLSASRDKVSTHNINQPLSSMLSARCRICTHYINQPLSSMLSARCRICTHYITQLPSSMFPEIGCRGFSHSVTQPHSSGMQCGPVHSLG